jgi:acylglycerol lipase
MEHVEGDFKGVRDTNIYYQGWIPDGDARAAVIIVHGLGEHSGRYKNVVGYLVPRGYAVYGMDLVGHGKSGGDREFVERFDDFTDTLTIHYFMVKAWQPERPIFLLGQSLGGLIASCYLLDHQDQFQGAVFSAPLVTLGESVSRATVLMARVLSVVAPRAGVAPLDTSALSRDPEVVKAYVDDPLVFHGKTPARMGGAMLEGMERVAAEAPRITLPFLAIQGGQDRLVDPAGTRMLYERAGSQDKTIKFYEGLYHDVFNEPEHEQVLQDVESWLAAHL